MRTLSLTIETVTPLFLAGAEPCSGELRTASFRGLMRYWLRAMLGANYSINELRAKEADIFGKADTKVGASKVTLITKGHKNFEPVEKKGIGYNYLYWSIQRTNRECLSPGQTFELILKTRPGVPDDGNEFTYASHALWLLLILGGVGSRSRRTAGSLSVIKSDGVGEPPDFILDSQNGEELCEEIRSGLIQIFNLCGKSQSISIPSDFDILHPSSCRIWIFSEDEQGWNSWKNAANYIGKQLSQSRRKLEPKQRMVFGIPLTSVSKKRRASPLHLKIFKLSNNKYYGGAVLFKSKFLPELNNPNQYQEIEKFIEVQPAKWEVQGW